MPSAPRHTARQQGNILFLILLAVVLFAALSYAVTSSMRGGGRDASSEGAKTHAATIIQQLAMVDNTIQRMTMAGVKPEHLDFNDGGLNSSMNVNSNCANDTCRVFRQMTLAPAPRGASDMGDPPNSGVWTPNREGKLFAILASIKHVGTTLPEIIIGYKGLNKATCDQINIMNGIYAEGAAMISMYENFGTGGTDYTDFAGNMDPFPALTADKWGSNDPRLIGRNTFCFYRGTVGHYAMHVVYPR